MAESGKPTKEEANAAMHDIMAARTGLEDESESATVKIEQEPAKVEPEPAAQAAESDSGEAASDDVDSLKKRLSDLETANTSREKQFQDRLDAVQRRFGANEQILRDRFLRKSTVVDKALALLKQAKSDDGVGTAEVDRIIREIEGTMNPLSTGYVPPTTQDQASITEEQAIVMNSFLNEKRMSIEEADQFASWLKGEASAALSPVEQAVAGRDLDGFLRIAHSRFDESMKQKNAEKLRADAAAAVKSVQRTQREAGRAASSSASAPRKQPTGGKTEIDVKKLTKDDISSLLRQTVEQYR